MRGALASCVVAIALAGGNLPVASAHVGALTVSTSIEGATRYDTAVSASQNLYYEGGPILPFRSPDGPTVVLATGENWPDALGGAHLAGHFRSPMLLTKRDSTPASVLAEIQRLEPSHVVILGGTAAVSEAVESLLAQTYTVERVSGDNRYATARAIVERARVGGIPDYKGPALVATGRDFPDALAGSPLATNGWPLFLVSSAGLDNETLTLMQETVAGPILILGGTSVVSQNVEDELRTEFGTGAVTRLGGANRYETARLIAEYGQSEGILDWDGLGIATGESFPDALAGGVMCGILDAPILLTKRSSLPAPTDEVLRSWAPAVNEYYFIGGLGAINQDVRDAVQAALK